MHIALITPTSILNDYCQDSKVHLCLAHMVLQDPQYCEFYRSQALDPQKIVIMDNSLWELGNAFGYRELREICEKHLYPTELIIPDVFRDGPGTVNSFLEFMLNVKADISSSFEFEGLSQRNFVVAQGQDRQEWLECFDFFNEHTDAHTIGLPKVLDDIWKPGGRIGCVEFLEATHRIRSDKQYHCLGIWDDPIEVLLLSKHSWIRSLDTALPVHAGLRDVRFHPELGLSRTRTKRPHGYFETPREVAMEHMSAISHNVSLLRRWSNGRNGS